MYVKWCHASFQTLYICYLFLILIFRARNYYYYSPYVDEKTEAHLCYIKLSQRLLSAKYWT